MSKEANHTADEWWVDLVEGETDPSLREDLTLLLMNSPAGRDRLNTIKELRSLVKDSDDVSLPEDGRFYQNMHDRIMAAVDGQSGFRRREPTSAKRRSLPRTSPRQLGFPALLGTPTLMALIAGVTWMTSDRQKEDSQRNSLPTPPPVKIPDPDNR